MFAISQKLVPPSDVSAADISVEILIFFGTTVTIKI
jgi:hypothetical protein